MNKIKGFFYGVITSITFGLIPLFTLPLLNNGLSVETILFYRYLFATIALAIMLLIKKESFKIKFKDVLVLLLLGLFYIGTSLFLFKGYEYMGAGVATTIHFTYPVFVTLFMVFIFRERSSFVIWLAILLAIFGVARLFIKEAELTFDSVSVIIVVLSAISYALYITGVNKSRIKTMSGRKLAFYVLLISSVFYGIRILMNGGIQPISDTLSFFNLLMLALVPTIISNITLVLAVHNIGATITSVLGAMEPIVAVCVGVFFFRESIAWSDVLGILMIVVAVIIIILSNKITRAFYSVFRRSRPRHA